MKLMFFLTVLFPCFAFADNLDCGSLTIEKLYVQGDRGGHPHENSLLLHLGDDKNSVCSNVSFAVMKNSEPAYSGSLSLALAAYTTGAKLRVVVNSSNVGSSGTHNILWVNTP